MTIDMIEVRHKDTGAKTFLPETALNNFPDYVRTPSQRSRDDVPDGTAFPPGTLSVDELDDDGEDSAEQDGEPPRTGAGATTDAWRRYASEVLHLELDDDEGRDSIIARVDATKS